MQLSGSLEISGSIIATQGITGSFSGSATSASYADTLGGLPSSSFAPAATFNTVSQSFATTSGSLSGRVSIVEGQDATTGSNTFTGVQYVSQASNAIGFTSTASLYTDGGLRVAKDSFVSGTAYFNNIIVYGTSSIEYITSSQVDIGANIITVNTDTPAVRFGGLSVFDSGSTQLTGSMLWDSQTNHWVYSNPSGSSYSGGMIMSGPRSSALGSEQGTTNNALMKGQGGDHITSSQMIDDGTTVRIPGNLQVTGSTILANTAFTGSVNVSGSFIVTTTAPELQVGATGVTLGNALTDIHQVTGSLRVSGSITTTGALTGTSATFTSGLINGTTDAFFDLNRSASGNAGRVRFQTAGTDDFEIGLKGGVAGFHITKGDVTELVTVLTSGNVGIGTTTPNSTLQVSKGGATFQVTDTNKNTSNTFSVYGLSQTSWTIATGNSGSFSGGEKITITDGGNIGIGTTIPNFPLDVKGAGGDQSLAPQTLQVNSTNGTSGQGTGIRLSSVGGSKETVGILSVENTSGTNGDMVFRLYNGGATMNEKMRITSGGNVGIGTSSPFAIADINTSINGNGSSALQLGVAGTRIAQFFATSGEVRLSAVANVPMLFYTNDTEKMRITSAGNVGIGTGNPDAFVASSGFGNLVVGNGSGEKGMTIYSGTTGRGGLMFADATTGSGAYIGYILYGHSTDTMEFATSSVPRLFIKADGRTWINGAISSFDGSSAILQINGFTRTSGQIIFHNPSNVAQAVSVVCNGADSLNVAGAFSANSKSFLISHPLSDLESTHNLRYVSVESPQADLIYRGKLTLVNGKAQANIDEAATMTEGTFEALCREVQCFTTNETGWDLVKGKVVGNIIYIESQNTNSTDEISWMVIGERKDKHMMDTSWTDDNGRVIVEPLIQEEENK